MQMNRFIFLFALFSLSLTQAQTADSIKKVPYTTDFRFKDGIFLNFEQVKLNRPVLKSRIIASIDYNDNQFFDKILVNDEIAFYDDLGMKQSVKPRSLWGYAKNGDLYIRMYDNFNRITYIGSICHFVATLIVSYQSYYDPYYYNPYYYYRYGDRPMNYTRSELRQFIIDFESGKIMDYEESNVGIVLMKDPELYDEYEGLRKRKKKQMKFFYMRKFNERNPLMLPEE
jgi:hypothetical protein